MSRNTIASSGNGRSRGLWRTPTSTPRTSCAACRLTSGSSSASERILSGLGRLNYGYDGKYLLTMSYRADGASKFAENNKWAYFPSAALAWRLGDEEFFRSRFPTISELKLRGSMKLVGDVDRALAELRRSP